MDTNLDDFVEERRRDLTAKEKLAISLLCWREGWEELEMPLIVMEKVKINSYVKSLGVGAGWSIGCGTYLCALCAVDGKEYKLQKVNHIGWICKECAQKYQKQIQETMEYVNHVLLTSRRLKKD